MLRLRKGKKTDAQYLQRHCFFFMQPQFTFSVLLYGSLIYRINHAFLICVEFLLCVIIKDCYHQNKHLYAKENKLLGLYYINNIKLTSFCPKGVWRHRHFQGKQAYLYMYCWSVSGFLRGLPINYIKWTVTTTKLAVS